MRFAISSVLALSMAATVLAVPTPQNNNKLTPDIGLIARSDDLLARGYEEAFSIPLSSAYEAAGMDEADGLVEKRFLGGLINIFKNMFGGRKRRDLESLLDARNPAEQKLHFYTDSADANTMIVKLDARSEDVDALAKRGYEEAFSIPLSSAYEAAGMDEADGHVEKRFLGGLFNIFKNLFGGKKRRDLIDARDGQKLHFFTDSADANTMIVKLDARSADIDSLAKRGYEEAFSVPVDTAFAAAGMAAPQDGELNKRFLDKIGSFFKNLFGIRRRDLDGLEARNQPKLHFYTSPEDANTMIIKMD